MTIWRMQHSVGELNSMAQNCMEEHLGIEIVELGNDYISATMPVDHRTRQPFGLLHGGASVVLAESLGSIASTLCIDQSEKVAVGIEINANHIRQVREGLVKGTARPLHLGNKIHVWEIRIVNSMEKLVCICRLTVAILKK
jgi:1,4-dihydroxy-2-naphthoyl-CoA hydrolase